MAGVQVGKSQLSPELEAIAQAAAERLRAQTREDAKAVVEAQAAVVEAAGAAIAAGAALGAVAEAERLGELRARAGMGPEVLERVKRAAVRQREADAEYGVAVRQAGRLGLSHREIAAAAQVTHATVRAILSRGIQGDDGDVGAVAGVRDVARVEERAAA